LEEPHVDDGGGEFDVAHALASDAAVGHDDAAVGALHSLVLHAAVLAAAALPIFLGAEDAFAEQTALLGAVGAVVDGARRGHLARRPAEDVLRAGQGDAHGGEVIDAIQAQVVGHARLPAGAGTPGWKEGWPPSVPRRGWLS